MKTFISLIFLLCCVILADASPMVYTTTTTNQVVAGANVTFNIVNGTNTISATGGGGGVGGGIGFDIANQIAETNAPSVSLSYNEGAFGYLSQILYSNMNPSYLWFGDSTGGDVVGPFSFWLQSNTVAGVQSGSPFINNSYLYATGTGTTSYTDPYYFWEPGSSVAMGPGSNVVWQVSYAGNYANPVGNRIQVWYYSSASNGVANILTNRNGGGYGVLGTINEATGTPEGALICTNYPVPLNNYLVEELGVSGQFRMPVALGVYNTNPGTGALLHDIHAPGLILQDWLNMGTNNIACLLTNLNPTVIEYDQTKGTNSFSNYVGFASYVNNSNLTLADVVVGSAQITGGESYDPPDTALQTAFIRSVAVSNNWVFWDNFTPFSVRNRITELGDSADTVPPLIHLNSVGYQWKFQIWAQQLRIAEIYASYGRFIPPYNIPTPYIQSAGGSGTNNSFLGNVTIIPTNNGNVTPIYFQAAQAAEPEIFGINPTVTNWFFQNVHNLANSDVSWFSGGQGLILGTGGNTGTIQVRLYPSGGLELGAQSADPGANTVAVRVNQTNSGTLQITGGITTQGSVSATGGGFIGSGAGITNNNVAVGTQRGLSLSGNANGTATFEFTNLPAGYGGNNNNFTNATNSGVLTVLGTIQVHGTNALAGMVATALDNSGNWAFVTPTSGGSGTVTSVGLHVDVAGVLESISGSPVTTSGFFTPTFSPAIQALNVNNGAYLTGIPPTTGLSGWPANSSGYLNNNGGGTLSWSSVGFGSTNFLHLYVTNQISFDGDGLTTGLEFASGSRIYETSGSVLEELGIAGINLNGNGAGVNVQDFLSVSGQSILSSVTVDNTLFVNNGQIVLSNLAGTTLSGGVTTTNLSTNAFFDGPFGPILAATTGGSLWFTNSWLYQPGTGTNEQALVSLIPLVTVANSGAFSAWSVPINILFTNYGGTNGATMGTTGAGLSGSVVSFSSHLGLITGGTGYALYFTNTSSSPTRSSGFVKIISQ